MVAVVAAVTRQYGEQRIHRNGLRDEPEHAQPVGAGDGFHFALGVLVGAARDDDRGAEAFVADLLEEFDAVHLRHEQVAHDHVDRLPLAERLERRASVGGPEQGADSRASQETRQELALQIVVVDDQHAQRAVLQAAVNPSIHETALCTRADTPRVRLDL